MTQFENLQLDALLQGLQQGAVASEKEALLLADVDDTARLAATAAVLRDQGQRRIPARELVPGDVVVLEGGDKVPADVRFIEVNNMHVDESSLTGESMPVTKNTDLLAGPNLVPGDQTNIGFSGTYVTRGTARAIVVETGRKTVFGQVVDMVEAADKGETPLQRKMKEFVHTLIIAIFVVGALNFIFSTWIGFAISYSFLGAVSLGDAIIGSSSGFVGPTHIVLDSVSLWPRRSS